ncbi:hypothetical protein [Methylosarcina fibrata]|uniref:hypothetical protein n=1 Tax=Methylosarcina fibrata TaxID=105972 RepID=UPI0003A8DA69|nr:hypothetical protein [Methylosarcina fibrata]
MAEFVAAMEDVLDLYEEPYGSVAPGCVFRRKSEATHCGESANLSRLEPVNPAAL